MQFNGKVSREMMEQKLLEARRTLDELRQLDNTILYDLGNPPELDELRGKILSSMRRLTGVMQEARRALDEQERR